MYCAEVPRANLCPPPEGAKESGRGRVSNVSRDAPCSSQIERDGQVIQQRDQPKILKRPDQGAPPPAVVKGPDQARRPRLLKGRPVEWDPRNEASDPGQ